jgi:hypothetical protein
LANKQIEEFPIVTSVEVGDILHLSRGGADRSITASTLVPTVGSSGTVIINTFKDGVEYTAGFSNTISISQTLASKNNAWVFFDGVYQEKETYLLSGTLITFDSVIPIGVSTIEVVMPLVLDVGQTSAENVIFSTNGNVEELLGKTLVFSNVAAIISATWLAIGMFCTTLGYSSAGDGGDNTYQIVAAGTGTPDGGEYIDLTGSSLQARGLFTKGHRTPKQYGTSSDVAALPDLNATPSVKRGNYYLTTGTTAITNFTEGRVGQTIHLQATDSITVQDNANIVLGDSSDYAMVVGDVLVLTQYEVGIWAEEARGSVGGGGSGSLSVTDGITTVNPATILSFDSNFVIANEGLGEASVAHKPDANMVFDSGFGLNLGAVISFSSPVSSRAQLSIPGGGDLFVVDGSDSARLSLDGSGSSLFLVDGGSSSNIGITASNLGDARITAGNDIRLFTTGPNEVITIGHSILVSDNVFSSTNDGTNTTVALQHNGSDVLVVDEIGIGTANVDHGFFGATPAPQQTIDSSDTDANRIAALEAALINLGLAIDVA